MQRKGIVWTPYKEPEYNSQGKFGTYNPTAARFGNEIRMLYRFAQPKGEVDESDIRLARSTDGLKGEEFESVGVVLRPEGKKEQRGVEDPRSQLMIVDGDQFYLVSYTGVEGKEGRFYLTHAGLATTKDFKTFERKGYLENRIDHGRAFADKNVVFFPCKINGKLWITRRPDFGHEEFFDMRLASSENLYGGYGFGEPIYDLRRLPWANLKVGAGTQPIEVEVEGERGWLELFHGVETIQGKRDDGRPNRMYRMGGMIFTEGPEGPEARYICKVPLLEPEEDYETGAGGGLVSNVVFPTGAVVVEGILKVYYGAGDGVIALCEANLDDLVKSIVENSISF